MAHQNALSAYKETRIRTAGQGQLIIMLYDGAIKNLDLACNLIDTEPEKSLQPKSIEKINNALVKAQEIITELMASLDFEQGGDIAENLFSLYNWFNRELLQANISRDKERIQKVRDFMDSLREAWQESATKKQAETKGAGSGVNIAG